MITLNDYIYSSVPPEVNLKFTASDKYTIKKIFMENPNKSYKAHQLAVMIGIKKDGLTNPAIRKIITELLELDLMPIVSTSKGFKLTTNYNELEKYQKTLHSRIQGIYRRYESIEKIKNKLL